MFGMWMLFYNMSMADDYFLHYIIVLVASNHKEE